jgi:predicted dienelactone hydrolase
MRRILALGTSAAMIGAAVATGAALAMKPAVPPQEIATGYAVHHIPADHRTAPIEVHIWYPTDDIAPADVIAQNALFAGFSAQIDATPAKSESPVVIFSHGSGGKAVQTGWFASQLAAQGLIVVSTNHQGTMSLDSDPHQTPMLWQRTRDLSAALDALENGDIGAVQPDMDRVAAMGFSLGGAAALSIGGAALSKADFISYCAQSIEKPDCDWMIAAGVDFEGIDQELYEADWSDPRIGAVLAIDPALTQAMTLEGLAQMDLPVMTLGLGFADVIPEAVDASHLADKLPNGRHVWIGEAAHFSFLPTCGIVGKIATSLMGDDNICSDWGLRNRDVIHEEIAAAASGFLAQVFAEPS